MDLPGVRVVRAFLAAPRPEPAFFVGAFRGVDLEVDRRAPARFVAVLLVDDFFADDFFADDFFAASSHVFFADVFFADFELGGLA